MRPLSYVLFDFNKFCTTKDRPRRIAEKEHAQLDYKLGSVVQKSRMRGRVNRGITASKSRTLSERRHLLLALDSLLLGAADNCQHVCQSKNKYG